MLECVENIMRVSCLLELSFGGVSGELEKLIMAKFLF